MLTTNHKFSSRFSVILIFFVFAGLASYQLGLSAWDDGLRHMRFALNQEIMHSWANVYPHSLFLHSYDPWHAWHSLLRIFYLLVNINSLPYLVNFFVSLSFLSLLYLNLSKISIPKSLQVLLCLIIVSLSSRYFNLRPDLLSGLYLLGLFYFDKNPKAQFLTTVLYSPCYYLFFIHVLIATSSYVVLARYKNVIALLMALFIGLVWHSLVFGYDYWHTVLLTLHDNQMRHGLLVGELKPFFDFIPYGKTLVLGLPMALLIALWLKFKDITNNTLIVFALLSSSLWLQHLRYYELYFPILCLALIYSLHHFLLNSDRCSASYHKFLNPFVYLSNQTLDFFLILLIASYFISSRLSVLNYYEKIHRGSFFQEERFNYQTILFNSLNNACFSALYFNPTVKIIPSCEVSWFEGPKAIEQIYHELHTNEIVTADKLKKLIDYTGSNYYVQLTSDKKVEQNLYQSIGLELIKSFDHAQVYHVTKNTADD